MKYSYQKIINPEQLSKEIRNSIITIALDYITTVDNAVDIFFKGELSTNEKNTLDSLVDSHIPLPPSVEVNKVEISNIAKVEVSAQAPFAAPVFRTKNDATDHIIEIVVEGVSGVDYVDSFIEYKLSEERYISGGEIVIDNAEFGDWMCASVYDKDGVIPQQYRSLICEDWPIVAKYINRRWIRPSPTTTSAVIDTRPLNARITPGLYLVVGYHAVARGKNRKIVANYDLQKKL